MKGREWYQEDETAEEYDEWRFSRGGELVDRREKQALLELVGDIEIKSVLEIACGTGRFTIELMKKGAHVTGVDISQPMIRQGVKKAKREGIDGEVDFIRGDAKRLPFPDNSFDLVVAMRFFHLVDEPSEYLREMARVSRSVVAFDTFSQSSTRRVYNRFLPMGSHLYSDDDVEEFVAKAGLKLQDRHDDFFFPFGLYRVTPRTVAEGIRGIDDTLQEKVGEKFCSVSYWMAESE
ncbi:MAG: methyltransferase domain-containing protein [Halobacteria archaeon]|nr:methyltransferase domain-containing protein [Halobacteria archaeon]